MLKLSVKAHRNSGSVQYILKIYCPAASLVGSSKQRLVRLIQVIPSPYTEGCAYLGFGEGESQVALPQTQLSPPTPSPPPQFLFLLKIVQWSFHEEGRISESVGWSPWREGAQREALPAPYLIPVMEVCFGRALGNRWNKVPVRSTINNCYVFPQ